MKYFTADLYEEFNSRDIDVADRAETQWGKATAKYEARLGKVRHQLSPSVRDLADKLCLHDAEVMALGHDAGSATILALLDNTMYRLTYGLTAKPAISRPRKADAFSSSAVRWLYDEVDMSRPGNFLHRILFSDGREADLSFDNFDYQVFELHPVGTREDLEPVLRVAEALEKSGEAEGGYRVSLSKTAALRAIAAAKRFKTRPNGHSPSGKKRVS